MLLITVPHGKPESSDNHDEGALQMLPHLTESLRDRGVELDTIVGDDVFRAAIDLNRTEAAGTEFFEDFRKSLLEADFHIDLHSFPYMSPEELDEDSITDRGDDLRDWSLSDVVLLRLEGVTDDRLELELVENLDTNITIDVVDTGYYNMLIVYSSVIMKTPSILIEVNEGSRVNYSEIAEAIAEVVANYLSSDSSSETDTY